MKNLLIAAILTLSLAFAAPALARDFECTGRTPDGRTVTVFGQFDSFGPYGEVVVARFDRFGRLVDGDIFEEHSYSINATSTFWTLNGFWHGMSVVIRHPEGRENQTYMRIFLNPFFDHEFNRATCWFSGNM